MPMSRTTTNIIVQARSGLMYLKSEISQILRAAGLYSALDVSEERGKIMAGKMFKLDLDQQIFLRTVAYDFEKKDIIVGGKQNF